MYSTVPVPATKVPPVPETFPPILKILEPPFKVPADLAQSPVKVCVSPDPRFKVPPVPFIIKTTPFTLPVKVTVPVAFVMDTFPVVVKPPMLCEAAVPVIVMGEDPKLTLALVLELIKLPVANVMVPVPEKAIVPVALFVILPDVCVNCPVVMEILPLLVKLPVVKISLPEVKPILPLLVEAPVVVLILPEVPVITPLLVKKPLTESVLIPTFKVAPEFTVTLVMDAFADKVTIFVPVVAIIAESPAAGTTPPTHVAVEFQFPPVEVLVLVAASTNEAVNNKKTTNNK